MFCVKVKKGNDEDSDLDKAMGILDKSIVLEKWEYTMFDTSLLKINGKDVDYKDFWNWYRNQLQQIHRDLDINFSQILTVSISLKVWNLNFKSFNFGWDSRACFSEVKW